jgi:hypothetical protein
VERRDWQARMARHGCATSSAFLQLVCVVPGVGGLHRERVLVSAHDPSSAWLQPPACELASSHRRHWSKSEDVHTRRPARPAAGKRSGELSSRQGIRERHLHRHPPARNRRGACWFVNGHAAGFFRVADVPARSAVPASSVTRPILGPFSWRISPLAFAGAPLTYV